MIIFGGTEIPSNRTLLERNGVENVMLNYWGLRKRGLPKTKAYLIGEHFLPHTRVWVDSGASQADKANLSERELEEYIAQYEEFIALNYDRIEGFTEFDSRVIGLPAIVQNRAVYENDPKLWVVWHKEYGQLTLQKWAQEYENIAIPHETIEEETTLSGVTRALQSRFGTKFHGLAIAKPDNLRQIPFSTVSTLSWLSPMRRGETIIWDGTKLARYPKKMKEQARPRYRAVVTKAGLDFDKFLADDNKEVTAVAIWSYRQLEKKLFSQNGDAVPDTNKPKLTKVQGGKKDLLSDRNDDTLYTGLMEMMGVPSNNSDAEVRKEEPAELVIRDPEEVVPLPVFNYQMKTIVDLDDEGREIIRDAPVVSSQMAPLRQCNTCFVAASCPAFKENNTCAFNLPVEVKTREQLKALLTAVIEMQGQRVAFMRFAEEMNGGYADPNVSQEMDRLFKLVKVVKELEENKEFIRITAERQSSGGVLSAIFGDRAQVLREMEQPINEQDTTQIIRDAIED